MLIGVPKETKDHEYRVGLTPAGVRALTEAGHRVMIERNAGSKIGFGDDAYRGAGARIAASAEDIYACDMVVKVKELQHAELPLLRDGLTLFCYLHLAPDPPLLQAMLDSRATGIAYETVTEPNGRMPLLIPMSQIAGRLAVQMGAAALTMANGGSGVLLSGVPGVAPAKVAVIGAGTVGANAARIAIGIGADVTALDRNGARLSELEEVYAGRIKTRYAETSAIEETVSEADLVIGALLLPGGLTPKVITRDLLKRMRPGSALVDVGIDQGGIAETSRPTTHSNPFYVEEGVVHYCVANMPAACSRTSTLALTQATLPYIKLLADHGATALRDNADLRAGLHVHEGKITYRSLAEHTGREYVAAESALARRVGQ